MKSRIRFLIAALLLPAFWCIVKYGLHIADRYLPAPWDVLGAWQAVSPSVLLHMSVSWLRLLVGYSAGVGIGMAVGIAWWRSRPTFEWSIPSVQALRSIPATATVPFFLLWFGFAETGRLLLIVLGISLNVAIAAHQSLEAAPEKYRIVRHSFGLARRDLPIRNFALPVVAETILPTLRFGLATAIGLVVVSEILGSQIGLGYLIQTARSTFSLHLVFLAAILFGIINAASDWMLRHAWNRIVFWRKPT